MVSTTVFVYASAIFSLFSAATAQLSTTNKTYTSLSQMEADLPPCASTCATQMIDMYGAECGSDTNMECYCLKSVSFGYTATREEAEAASTTSPCQESCVGNDNSTANEVIDAFANTCIVNFVVPNPAKFGLTPDALCILGMLPDCNISDTLNSTSSNTTIHTNGTNATNAASSNVEFQADSGASSLLMSSLLIAAVPAVLSLLI